MEKVDSKTFDICNDNYRKLCNLFPEINIDGNIDFDKLKELIGEGKIEKDEKYEFTWHGKNDALLNSQQKSTNTLILDKSKSDDSYNTNNIYIEGDNYEVLKILQKAYNRKIKMIYIDPPYNTGSEFVYHDDYSDSLNNYLNQTNQENKVKTEKYGRFHTEWLNMMYPRLRLARNLLSEDGIIFISIDDNELANLKKICDEIFGEANFESCIAWRRRTNQPNDKSKMIAKVSENILVYAKNSEVLSELKSFNGIPLTEDRKSEYKNPDNDSNGPWSSNPWKAATGRGGTQYTIVTPTGKKFTEKWYGNQETFNALLKENKIHWTDNGNGYPRVKIYLKDAEKNGQAAINFFTPDKYGSNQDGSSELESIFKVKGIFDNPKPTKLIKNLINIATSDNDIILDFFSGSATTADAVMQLNAESGSSRKYIMIQLPENCYENSIAFENGYKTICDIGEERIRRAGKKIKEENGLLAQDLDVGFKVFKLDSSNIKLWNGENIDINNANEYFYEHMDPIVEGRTEEDLLYEILLKEGMMLSSPIEEKIINNKKVYSIGMGYMIVCLNDDTDIELVREIGKLNPETVIFKDSGFVDENAKANALQELKKMGIDEEKVKSI